MTAKDEQHARSHEGILVSARRVLRERGIAGMRVADVMKGAGLTVGGFYAHFDSKEALVAETLAAASQTLRARIFDGLEALPAAERLVTAFERYVSREHRDRPQGGCPLPAVVSEVATTAREYEVPLEAALERLVKGLEAQAPALKPAPRRALSLGVLALMFGGLSLARAVKRRPLSDEILEATLALGHDVIRRATARSA